MSLLQGLVGLARFETRLGWRLIRVWVLGILSYLVSVFVFAYYTGLNQFSGWLGSGTVMTGNVAIMMPPFMLAALVGLVGIFYTFDWRHRDDAALFSPTLDASPLEPVTYAWGKFLGLLLPLTLPFVLLAITQVIVLKLPILDTQTPAAVFFLAHVLAGLLPALVLSALAFGLAGLTGNRAIAILVPIGWLIATFAVAFTMPEWLVLLVGGLYELPIYSNWIGYETNPLFWLQRLVVVAQLVFFVSLGACGRFAVARKPGLQLRHLVALVTGGLWVSGLLLLWLTYAGQGSDRQAVLDAEAKRAALPVATVLDRDLSVDIAPGSSLSGEASLRLRNDSDTGLDSLVFRLNGGLEVNEVTWDGQAVSHERDVTVVTVAAPGTWEPGAEATLMLAYEGVPDNVSSDAERALEVREMDGNLRGNARFFGTLPLVFEKGAVLLATDSGWYPEPGVLFGHEFPSRLQPTLAPSRLSVTVPSQWTAASVGRRSGGQGRFEFVSEVPVAGFSLNAAQFAEFEVEIGGVLFRVLHHPTEKRNVEFLAEAGDEIREAVAELMTETEQRTGLRYPHPELTLVEVPQQVAAHESGWDKRSRLAPPGVVMVREGGVFGARFEMAFRIQKDRFEDASGGGGGGGITVRVGGEDVTEGQEDDPVEGEDQAEDGAAGEEGSDGDAEAADAAEAESEADEDDESLTTFDPGRAKFEILERFVRTDWVGGDIPQMAFRSAWGHRIRTEDAASPVVGFALTNYLGELAFRRAPFDHPDMERALNSPQFQQAIRIAASGGDGTDLLVGAISDMDVVYRTLRTTPLDEVDPQELGADFLGLMHLKGRQPLKALHDTLGRQDWNEAIVELLEAHDDGSPLAWAEFRRSLLSRADDEQRADLATLFDNWLTGTELPGFVVTDAVAQRLAGELERWQVTAIVTNKGDAPGVAQLRAGRGDEQRTRLVSVQPGEELVVGIVTQDKPRTWSLGPYLSMNRSEPGGTLELREDPVEAEPFEGVRPAEVLGMIKPVVIDNQDPGFTVTLEDGRQVPWDGEEDGERVLESVPSNRLFFLQPSKWTRWRTGPRTYRPHGLFELTAAIKKVTDEGELPAQWRASLPEPGLYRVEAYLPPSKGRVSRELVKEWSFVVHAEGADEDVSIATDAAQEGWNDLGRFRFELDAEVELRDRGDDGIVIADAVRFVKEAP